MTADESEPLQLTRGKKLRKDARRAFGSGVVLIGIDDSDAEATLRSALSTAASAYNWLEDTELEEEAHRDLHKYGRVVRENFPHGCHLHWTGSSYEHRCPIAIAHKRVGFSIGFTAKRHCSICDKDLSECPHIPGDFYEVDGGTDPDGRCRVCLEANCADHVEGQKYRARACSIIREAEMHEISLVGRPMHPDARLTALPIDTQGLAERLGEGFEPGMDVSCDQCLGPCWGVDRPFEQSGYADPLEAAWPQNGAQHGSQ